MLEFYSFRCARNKLHFMCGPRYIFLSRRWNVSVYKPLRARPCIIYRAWRIRGSAERDITCCFVHIKEKKNEKYAFFCFLRYGKTRSMFRTVLNFSFRGSCFHFRILVFEILPFPVLWDKDEIVYSVCIRWWKNSTRTFLIFFSFVLFLSEQSASFTKGGVDCTFQTLCCKEIHFTIFFLVYRCS